MDYIFKLLFNQHTKTQSGILFDELSQKIEIEIGQIEEQVRDSALFACIQTADLLFKFIQEQIAAAIDFVSITELSSDAIIIYLCKALSQQIVDIEYFIQKLKSFYAKLCIGGLRERHQHECEQQMKTIERRICTQMLLISNACLHLTNTRLPLGACMEALIKLLMQYYVCLANLTKHFMARNKTIPLSMTHSKYEQLIKAIGKSLPLRIYRMFSYIEDNIFDEDADDEVAASAGSKRARMKNPRSDKAKIVRDTKYIPKLILHIENFNKFVNCLSKKTKHDLAKLLHFGTVRDFRIKTADLREAVERTFRENERTEVDDDDDDADGDDNVPDSDSDINDVDDVAAEADEANRNDVEPIAPVTSSSSCEAIVREPPDDAKVSTQNVIANVAAINRRVSKRRKRVNENEADVEPTAKRNSRRKK